MSPALADLPVRKAIQALESVGFAYVRTKGSHAVYRDQEGRVVSAENLCHLAYAQRNLAGRG